MNQYWKSQLQWETISPPDSFLTQPWHSHYFEWKSLIGYGGQNIWSHVVLSIELCLSFQPMWSFGQVCWRFMQDSLFSTTWLHSVTLYYGIGGLVIICLAHFWKLFCDLEQHDWIQQKDYVNGPISEISLQKVSPNNLWKPSALWNCKIMSSLLILHSSENGLLSIWMGLQCTHHNHHHWSFICPWHQGPPRKQMRTS